MFSRRDGVLLGGTHEEGNWSLAVDETTVTAKTGKAGGAVWRDERMWGQGGVVADYRVKRISERESLLQLRQWIHVPFHPTELDPSKTRCLGHNQGDIGCQKFLGLSMTIRVLPFAIRKPRPWLSLSARPWDLKPEPHPPTISTCATAILRACRELGSHSTNFSRHPSIASCWYRRFREEHDLSAQRLRVKQTWVRSSAVA